VERANFLCSLDADALYLYLMKQKVEATLASQVYCCKMGRVPCCEISHYHL